MCVLLELGPTHFWAKLKLRRRGRRNADASSLMPTLDWHDNQREEERMTMACCACLLTHLSPDEKPTMGSTYYLLIPIPIGFILSEHHRSLVQFQFQPVDPSCHPYHCSEYYVFLLAGWLGDTIRGHGVIPHTWPRGLLLASFTILYVHSYFYMSFRSYISLWDVGWWWPKNQTFSTAGLYSFH